MVSIAGCWVFSAQPALSYLRGGRGGGEREGGEAKERDEEEEEGGGGAGRNRIHEVRDYARPILSVV